jgi:hypothetical protein
MMSMEALKRLLAPAFFLLVFLLPAVYLDEAILQVSSRLLQRAIRIGHYVQRQAHRLPLRAEGKSCQSGCTSVIFYRGYAARFSSSRAGRAQECPWQLRWRLSL